LLTYPVLIKAHDVVFNEIF